MSSRSKRLLRLAVAYECFRCGQTFRRGTSRKNTEKHEEACLAKAIKHDQEKRLSALRSKE